MKYISSSYDSVNQVANVTMQHLGKKFIGTAKANPDSQYPPSEFAGCHYAEIRAVIKALKYERKLAKEDAEACRKFVQSIEHYSKFDPKDESAKSMYRQLNVKIKKVNDLTDEINDHLRTLDYLIRQRPLTLEAMAERKKSKENNA